MTKKEMIQEMSVGLRGVDINNRMRNTKARVTEVYNWYLNSKQTVNDRKFCMTLLTVW